MGLGLNFVFVRNVNTIEVLAKIEKIPSSLAGED